MLSDSKLGESSSISQLRQPHEQEGGWKRSGNGGEEKEYLRAESSCYRLRFYPRDMGGC